MNQLTSWVNILPNSDFSIYNLPFGVFKTAQNHARIGIRIGDFVLDLALLADHGYFDDLDFDKNTLRQSALNSLIACGKKITVPLREKVQNLLQIGSKLDQNPNKNTFLVPIEQTEMLLPVQIGDYTDFYASIDHATNVGKMFRPDEPLLPNWKHLPIAYHGRASSIVPSGTKIRRPKGQIKPKDQEFPSFQASKSLDFELEMAMIVGKENQWGTNIEVSQAEEYIFGLLLFNDWSARDIQRWEYVPLGPFLGKNFGSSVSCWVVTLEALDFCRVPTPAQEPAPLPYLQFEGNKNFDIALEVFIQPKNASETLVCQSNYALMYWNLAQQIAHHTSGGCNLRIGDLLASGTLSGNLPNSYGSMLELAWQGTKPLPMSDGTTRTFIQDHDTVIMRAFAEKNGIRVGFGEVRSEILESL